VIAVTRRKYGPPKVLQLSEIPEPLPGPGQLRLQVAAASVNPYDLHMLRGDPYLMRVMMGLSSPKVSGLGADVAGTVGAVGEGVEGFDIGDEVFGWGDGTFAASALASTKSMAHKPQALSFEAAACLPCAGVTALQALRDNAGLRAGQRVLINGAAGGVGTMAVQIAKSLGASVTGVCGSSSVELVRSLGADSVIDYSMQDFARGLEPFDVVLDLVGNRTLRSLRRAAGHDGVVVVATGPSGKWIGPLRLIAEAKVKGRFVSQRLETLMANVISTDLDYLAQLCLSGALTPIVERTFPLAETATAMSLLETGHVHGKVVIDVATSTLETGAAY